MYLTTQLMELNTKLIVALNMADMLEKKGIKIDTKKLEEQLGVKVFEISALKETGIDALIAEIDKKEDLQRAKVFDSRIENSITEIQFELNRKHSKFIAVKLLEDDERFKNENSENINKIKKELSKNYDTDLEETIATERYDFIERVKKRSVVDNAKRHINKCYVKAIFHLADSHTAPASPSHLIVMHVCNRVAFRNRLVLKLFNVLFEQLIYLVSKHSVSKKDLV